VRTRRILRVLVVVAGIVMVLLIATFALLRTRFAKDRALIQIQKLLVRRDIAIEADGFTYAARAEAILLGLGFEKEDWTLDTAILSGGQKNRLGMARLLLSNADVLLLDEPTNHLDVHAVEWLEEFLFGYDKAYVVISHDRYFLDRTTNRIIEIENGKAVNYKGNYSKFVIERELRREQQQREFENQQSLINKTQAFIRKNLEGQKTKQAKSRRNMLERMERVEAVASEKSGGNFGLKRVERTGGNVLNVEDLDVGYGEKILASKINISLLRGETLGIMGANGTGKTTLLKTLLGEIRELGGEVNWGTKVDIGYYSQNLHDLEPRNEVVMELRRVAPMADNGELRSFLARFLFFGEDVFKSVGDLSGGEKGRLSLAKLIYSRKNVLILDEPTNHLDIPAREALEAALAEYDGTIITVSHDRFFLDKIATQILAFEDNGAVDAYPGNYTEYHDWKARTAESGKWKAENRKALIETPGRGGPFQAEKTAAGKSPALSKNQRAQAENRIKKIESEIADLEKQLARLAAEMSDPRTSGDFEKLNSVTMRHGETDSQIKSLYADWDTLTSQLER